MSSVRAPARPRRRPRAITTSQFVERLAIALETDGFPRIAGRIFGLLLISEGQLSLDSITESVGASKASASVNTRMLEEKGLIERISLHGDRRDYYTIASDLCVRTMEQRLARWERVHGVVEDAMSDTALPVTVRARLKDFDSASETIREILEAALARLKTPRRRS